MSTPLRRREEEITAGYLLVTAVTNAVVQATILHRHRITFKSRFRPCRRRVIDPANERKNPFLLACANFVEVGCPLITRQPPYRLPTIEIHL